jgi:hypothetical protein
MKFALRWSVVLMLATILVAQTAPKKSTRKIATKAAAQAAVTAEDVQALKDALAAQQKQIQQLQDALQQTNQNLQQSQQQLQQAQSTATDAQQKAASVAAADSDQKDTVTKLSSDMADVKTTLTNTGVNTQDEQKRFAALESAIGRFRFTGDVRVRGESFFQNADGTAAPTDRERARIRVRFGLEGKLGDDFIGGFSIATGTLGDPTTTNETFTNNFDRKTIGLDKGYIIFQPKDAKWISATAGKFAYTWQRTNQTFDPDLNPEGFALKFSYDLKTPYVKNVSVQPLLLYFNEANPGIDSYIDGVQFAGKVQIGRLTSTPSFSLLKFNSPDTILQSSAFATQATSTTGGGKVPGEGPGCTALGAITVPPCVFAANGMTNATFFDATGKPHFYSQWFYSDLILNNQIRTPWARLPLNLVLEYENNLDAKDHPLAPTGNLNVLTSLGKQSHLYLGDLSLGQAKNKHDFQFGYMWERQEQDSVIASFDESDQRAPTNILQNKFYATWKPTAQVTAGYTLWIGRTLNTGLENASKGPGVTVGVQDNYLKRMQFDLIYAF